MPLAGAPPARVAMLVVALTAARLSLATECGASSGCGGRPGGRQRKTGATDRRSWPCTRAALWNKIGRDANRAFCCRLSAEKAGRSAWGNAQVPCLLQGQLQTTSIIRVQL